MPHVARFSSPQGAGADLEVADKTVADGADRWRQARCDERLSSTAATISIAARAVDWVEASPDIKDERVLRQLEHLE